LVEIGDEVTVLSSATNKEQPKGGINGVQYVNFGRGKGLRNLLKALVCIIKQIRKTDYDAVIVVSNSLMLLYPMAVVCRTKGIKYIQEKSEFPFVLMKKGFLRRQWASFYTSTTYKLFDGLIVMTKPLMEYFSTKVRKTCKLI